MAVENPIVDSGPTSPRKTNKQLYMKRVGAIPPASYPAIDDDGFLAVFTQPAERVGQFVYYRPVDRPSYDRRVTMYVVVDVSGEGLQWKPVAHEFNFIDSNTGQPWDPLSFLPGA